MLPSRLVSSCTLFFCASSPHCAAHGRRTVAAMLTISILALGLPVPVQAGIVPTNAQSPDQDRVARILVHHGVGPLEARARAAALSNEEAGRVLAEFDALPAGGSRDEAFVALSFITVVIVGLPDFLVLGGLFWAFAHSAVPDRPSGNASSSPPLQSSVPYAEPSADRPFDPSRDLWKAGAFYGDHRLRDGDMYVVTSSIRKGDGDNKRLVQLVVSHGCGYCHGENDNAKSYIADATLNCDSRVFEVGRVQSSQDWLAAGHLGRTRAFRSPVTYAAGKDGPDDALARAASKICKDVR